jgi:hypothetical protein
MNRFLVVRLLGFRMLIFADRPAAIERRKGRIASAAGLRPGAGA